MFHEERGEEPSKIYHRYTYIIRDDVQNYIFNIELGANMKLVAQST